MDGGDVDQEQKEHRSGAGGEEPAPAGAGPAAPTGEVAATPGVQLLLEIGARHPEYLLSGAALRDQGVMVTGMLAAGWQPAHVEQVVTGRPLPERVTTSVGAIVAARLRAAAAGPVPPAVDCERLVPEQATAADDVPRSVADEIARRVLPECRLCGQLPVKGTDLCAECSGWPECTACTGPTPRRVDPAGPGICRPCQEQGRQSRQDTDSGHYAAL